MLNGEGIRNCRCASVRPLDTSGCTAAVQNQPSIIYPACTRDSSLSPVRLARACLSMAFCIYGRIWGKCGELYDAQPILTGNLKFHQNSYYHLLS
ncbi:hypothetical protein K443DRAFT_448240 [Laccaria amethystina LaAM-08-1]|uniref:Uncharacterized protein n=1 Tax=Laccaria amethystina LaAM-08-1 TaxID=1095629 RepID=A0A0C9XVT1_9AGAR|nr:hypothetical protein K443DRAFT_448240 [Laccaria amethystina LaAM-08-1]